jgi:hypothetical protein
MGASAKARQIAISQPIGLSRKTSGPKAARGTTSTRAGVGASIRIDQRGQPSMETTLTRIEGSRQTLVGTAT